MPDGIVKPLCLTRGKQDNNMRHDQTALWCTSGATAVSHTILTRGRNDNTSASKKKMKDKERVDERGQWGETSDNRRVCVSASHYSAASAKEKEKRRRWMERREGSQRILDPEEECRERMSPFWEDEAHRKERSCLLSLDTVSTPNSLCSRFQRQTLVFVLLIGRPL